MHDILDPEPELRPGERDSLYSMGILLGILAVALDLIVALIAAANVAIASHLSLRSPRKKSNFESHFKWRLIFCMVMQFVIGILSGASLFLLSLNISTVFGYGVGFLFAYGFLFLGHFAFQSFGFNPLKLMFKVPLSALSLALSTLAVILDACLRNKCRLEFTILIYGFSLIYQLFIHSQRIPIENPDWRNIGASFVFCSSWMVLFLLPLYCRGRGRSTIIVSAASGLEAILLAYICIVGLREKWRQHRRHIRGPTSPV